MMSDAKKDAKRQAVKNDNKEKLEPLTNWYESPSKVKRCWIKNCVVETVGKESTPSRTLRAKSGTVDCKYVVVSHCSEMAFKRVFFSGFLSEILAPTGFITTACRGNNEPAAPQAQPWRRDRHQQEQQRQQPQQTYQEPPNVQRTKKPRPTTPTINQRRMTSTRRQQWTTNNDNNYKE